MQEGFDMTSEVGGSATQNMQQLGQAVALVRFEVS